MTLDFLGVPHVVLWGPTDVGTEQRWRIRLEGGRTAVVGQLAPDLARDLSIRRRYVRDAQRLRAVAAIGLAPVLAMGPTPDPRDPDAAPPWRMRLDPEGVTLEALLRRAPFPLEEVSQLFAALADAVHSVHATGAVVRDLRPENVLRTNEGRLLLVDIGLSRVDVLSSHTASSLLFAGSKYAAPEQLHATAVDQRSDIFSLGVMLWEALTGTTPFDDGPPLLFERKALVSLRALRADVPDHLVKLVDACLQQDPARRPASVNEIAWILRGGAALAQHDGSTTCQSCGASLRLGQRLCLACGKLAVRFFHARPDESSYGLDLVRLREDAEQLRWLEGFLLSVANPPMRKPEFIIGSVHMYGEDERRGRMRLPARLFGNLGRDSARELADMMRVRGLKVRVVAPGDAQRARTRALFAVLVTVAASVGLSFLSINPVVATIPGVVFIVWFLVQWTNRMSERYSPPRYALRPAPAALPASDPLVARLAALLQEDPPTDIRAIVADLALLVQRLVDHRASFTAPQPEIDALTEPLRPLVEAVETHVQRLVELDVELARLDESAMVRALAAAEARADSAEQRESVLTGLDRLRALEDERAAVFHRLLEVKALLERTVDLGLAVHDPEAEHERQVALALRTLEPAG